MARRTWVFCIFGIIALGLLSRVVRTGWLLFDKYLGDALYAAMVYGILRLVLRAPVAGALAMVVMTAIEVFQLTLIPARMVGSEFWLARICGRLLGVSFSYWDMLAYGVGIAGIYFVEGKVGEGGRGVVGRDYWLPMRR